MKCAMANPWRICANQMGKHDLYEKIRQQILLLNPMAEEKTIRKFIRE